MRNLFHYFSISNTIQFVYRSLISVNPGKTSVKPNGFHRSFTFKLFRRNNRDLGDRGEKLAVKFLRRQGYKILERNFRLKLGEIDIVARDGNQLVFVEVKTRSSDNQEFLRTSVNRGKEKRLAKTASYYLGKQKYQGLTSRFDVVFVVADNGKAKIEHVKDAF